MSPEKIQLLKEYFKEYSDIKIGEFGCELKSPKHNISLPAELTINQMITIIEKHIREWRRLGYTISLPCESKFINKK